jgi:hypothetical protein
MHQRESGDRGVIKKAEGKSVGMDRKIWKRCSAEFGEEGKGGKRGERG